MRHNPRSDQIHRQAHNKLALYERALEAIDYLITQNGHFPGSKQEFAVEMAARHGRVWCNARGLPDRTIVADVMNLTRDQDSDFKGKELFAGMTVAYSPTSGGLTLIDPTGEMPLAHQLHFLAGDMLRQQCTKTENRRRLNDWKAAGMSAMNAGNHDLGRLCFQIENEIDSSGMASDTLTAQYFKLIHAQGVRLK